MDAAFALVVHVRNGRHDLADPLLDPSDVGVHPDLGSPKSECDPSGRSPGMKRSLIVEGAVSGIFYTFICRPVKGQGKTDGTGTRGNRPGGPEDQGKPRQCKSIKKYAVLFPSREPRPSCA